MAFVVASSIILSSVSHGQQPRSKPREIELLSRYVGNWTSDVTSKPAGWTPAEERFRTSNHAEFVLDGWFLKQIEVSHVADDPRKVTKALWFQAIDPRAERFVMWFFQSTGVIGKAAGVWDPQSHSFEFTASDLPPNVTGKHTEAFPDDRTINGSYLITEAGGRPLFDMVWTRKRQAGVAGQPLHQRWARAGTPIEPIPPELKKLQPFIGEWDAEFTQRPSAVSLKGRTSKGTMTAKWILDGRFLMGTTEVGNHKGIWVIGYDSNKEAYRSIRMTNTGQIDESIGQWNDDVRLFLWKIVNERPGITRTSTSRVVGKQGICTHVLAEDKEGKVHLDLTIRGTRRHKEKE